MPLYEWTTSYLFIHLLTDTGVVNRPWSFFYLSFIVENAAMNIDLQKKKQTYFSSCFQFFWAYI